jgi:hypothetical protein
VEGQVHLRTEPTTGPGNEIPGYRTLIGTGTPGAGGLSIIVNQNECLLMQAAAYCRGRTVCLETGIPPNGACGLSAIADRLHGHFMRTQGAIV